MNDVKSRRVIVVMIAVAVIALAAVGVFLIRHFFPSTLTLEEVTTQTVESVELFEYTYSANPQGASRTVITSAEVIPELTRAFDQMPATPFDGEERELAGKPATAYRFHVAGGQYVEVTQVFLGEQNVVVFWPNGEVYRSSWGRPFDGFYDELGTTDTVPGAQVPLATTRTP